ncbi:MAG TPA: ABC transporter permease, partial [Polyangiaceae bacterium]|nr:ABC transporter permease [Polyangiaceae bacterium]
MSNQLQHVKSAALSLAANKTRSALTMLGISIGVLAVTLLVSVGEGAKSSVETSLTSIGTNLLSVVPGRIEAQGFGYLGAAVRKPLVIEDSELLERQATHLAAVTPVVLGNASIQFAGRARSTNIFGVGPRFLDVRNIRLESGSFLSSEDIAARRRVVILGRTLVDSILDGKPAIGSSVRVGGERFRVVGVTERKGRSLGIDLDDMALVPVSVAAEFFEQTSLNQILAAAKSDTDAELASQQIDELLAGRRRGERSFTIQTQDDLLRVFDSITSAMSWT